MNAPKYKCLKKYRIYLLWSRYTSYISKEHINYVCLRNHLRNFFFEYTISLFGEFHF